MVEARTRLGHARVLGLAVLAGAVWLAGPPARAQEKNAARPPKEAAPAANRVAVDLPGGRGGIGLDDLRYSEELGKVLVPAGRTGKLDLVDPKTRAVTSVGGFSEERAGGRGHGEGITSVDEGAGFLFVTDRTARTLDVVSLRSRSIVARAPLASGPDYVRYVAPTREVWVTEPEAESIEVFSLSAGSPPKPGHAAVIRVPGGPEALVVDAARGRAYTNLWKDKTVALDLKTRSIVAQWPNGCAGSRGLALDPSHGWLFVGCSEGQAEVLDVAHGGNVLSSAATGRGVDIIAYDPALRHLYVPGGTDSNLTILGVTGEGKLALLGTVPTTPRARAVAAGGGTAFVADPVNGRLLAIRDPYPAGAN